MIIKNDKDLEGMKAIGQIVGNILRDASTLVKPNITPKQIEYFVSQKLKENKAVHAPIKRKNFPSHICISVNEEAVHGIPDNRVFKQGDVVKLDLIAEKNDYIADAAVTIVIPQASRIKNDLKTSVEVAFSQAMHKAKVGNKVSEIGKSIEETAAYLGFFAVRSLSGHGVGRDMWESPTVYNYYNAKQQDVLEEGMVIAVEPIISTSSPDTVVKNDGWTVSTLGGGVVAHYEHTIVIQQGKPLILTNPQQLNDGECYGNRLI